MSSSTTLNPPLNPLRQDAGVMGLVGTAHMCSHFSQLLLAPLFPWLKDAFNASYTELGFLMTLFFVVSCAVQTASGFLVDRHGPRPILFAGLGMLALAALGFSLSTSYWMLAVFAMLAGMGNGVFHPADYTLLNRKVSAPRLGYAYSVHGITGSLGWALAPVMLVPLALAFSWRVALASASAFLVCVMLVLWWQRDALRITQPAAHGGSTARGVQPAAPDSSLGFLRIPAVWMCFGFFFFYAMVVSVVQAFAPEAARQIHGVPIALAAVCLTVYMICSSAGMVAGGFLAANATRCERIVGAAFGVAAGLALTLALADLPAAAVPVVFGFMGFASGIAGPSRDLLVKQSTPPNATGRVYGVVYSGLDIGQASAPLIFGVLMDGQRYATVLVGLALVQGVLIASAFNVRRARRTALAA